MYSKYKCFFVLAGVLLCGVQPAVLAQRLPTPDALTVDDGLCFRHVTAITQDKNGLMWFGTTNGLSRYDGYRFVNFGEKTATVNYFPALYFAENGMLFRNDSILWSIADSKLWAMNIHNFETKAISGVDGRVLKMTGGKHKDIWLVSDNDREQFLWHFTEQNGFKKVSAAPHFRLDFTAIDIDTSGGVWWSTTTKGLQQFSPTGKFMSAAKIDSFFWYGITMYYNDFFIDSHNRFFVYSMNKLNNHQFWRYFPESGQKEVLLGGMKDILFTSAEDSEGNIWFTNEGGLLQLQPDGHINDFTELIGQALDFTKIFSVFEDRTNTLWIGTDGGLLKLPVRKQVFDTYFSKKNAGWGNAMRGICEGPKGDLFFFCETGDVGLYRMDKKGGRVEKLSFGMDEADYRSTLELANFFVFDQKRNCLWTMTDKLLKIDLSNQKIVPQPAISFGREFSSFNPLVLLSNGQLLLGNTLDKLTIFDPDSDRIIYLFGDNSMAYAGIYPKTLLVQGNDSIWVGTNTQGLYLFKRNGDLLKYYNTASQPALSNNQVLCLHFDEKNNSLWVGTFNGGMCSIDLITGNLRVFNQQNGLPDKNVVSILGDGDNLWLGTYNGLSRFNKKEETFHSFHTEDGLTDNEFNYSSAFKSSDGQLYFGGMNGINAFYPKDLLQQEFTPPLQLTRFTKYDQHLGSLIDVQLDGNHGQEIKISPDISFFTFEWTLPNYLNPDKNQYFTWMEGLEAGWSYLGNTPRIRFNKLPPGEYTLHLKGKDSRGNWSKKPIDLKIKVITPWWKRWWAFCLYFVIVATAIALLRKRELSRLRLQNELEKEQVEAQKLWELEQAKSRFFTNLSHEFRTPLTVIMGMTEQLAVGSWQSAVSPTEQGNLRTTFSLIRRNSENLLRLTNQMLDLSKLDSGAMKMDMVQGDIINYLKYLTESFHSMAQEKKVQLTFYSEIPELVMDFDEEKIQHVIYNLLSNALKFIPSTRDGKVVLHVNKTERNGQSWLQLKVQDTGIGIPEGQLAHIFDRFYQADNSSTRKREGTGIGLALTRELVELMGGSISVESTLGEGTNFTLLLPIRLEANKPLPQTGFPSSRALSPELAPDLPAPSVAKAPDEQEALAGNKPVLLIIEDNADVVTYIVGLLEKEYDIITAPNGQAGIEKAFEIIPDIIISDVMMPEKDGYEVCETLKTDERTSHIPIILLTAKAEASDRIAGLRKGADAYLMKPFNKEELYVRLEKLLELRRALQLRYSKMSDGVTSGHPVTSGVEPTLDDLFLQKLQNTVMEHLGKAELGAEELSRTVHLSPSQLYRKMNALTGEPPNAFIRKIRLHRALELLQTTELNISEIAYDVGFNDPNYFSRAFHKEFGKAPSEYRN